MQTTTSKSAELKSAKSKSAKQNSAKSKSANAKCHIKICQTIKPNLEQFQIGKIESFSNVKPPR